MKKGFLLSLDALVAVGLLFILVAFLSSISLSYNSPEIEYQRFYYAGKDMMNVIEKAKLKSVIEYMPENFSSDCNITESDLDKTILDSLGYLWAQNLSILNSCAENVTNRVLNLTLPDSFGYEALLENTNITRKGEPGEYISRLHTIVSGYELGMPVSGYFSSAFLARMKRSTSSYAYFGGYVGDGNISRIMTIPFDSNVTEAIFEANIGSNFSFYVNGILVGDYSSKSTNFTANKWILCPNFTVCDTFFSGGNNTIEINFIEYENSYIGGGFIKVTYNTTKPDTRGLFSVTNDTQTENFLFPGIRGIMNLYSGFYIPGTLNNMSLYLHYKNDIIVNSTGLPVFFILGDSEIIRSNQSGEVKFSYDDSVLRGFLNYSLLSNSTIPLRFGMETFRILSGVGSSDVVLITDRSGSMGNEGACDVTTTSNADCPDCELACTANCDDTQNVCENVCKGTWTEVTPMVYVCVDKSQDCCDTQDLCTDCGGIYDGYRIRINVAKDSDDEFIDTVLDVKGSRTGLVGYGSDICSFDELTDNSTYLHNEISTYNADCGGTCICCGVNKAVDLIVNSRNFYQLNNSRFTGPSIGGWVESGLVNLSAQALKVDELRFETDNINMFPDFIHISGDSYAAVYEQSSDDTGWIATFNISSDGSISSSITDIYEFDSSRGEYPQIIHVSGEVYAIVYRGSGSDGYIKTVIIGSDGDVKNTIDTEEFLNEDVLAPRIIHISGDVYAIFYEHSNSNDGWIRTYQIQDDGTIGNGNIDNWEYTGLRGEYADAIHVSGEVYAFTFRGSGTDGYIATAKIESDGNIVEALIDIEEYLNLNILNPRIVHVSGNIYAILYELESSSDGYVRTIEIQNDGSISSTEIDLFEYDTNRGEYADIIHMFGNYFAITFRGPDNDGYVKVLEISSDGNINDEIIETFEFENDDIYYTEIEHINSNIYAIATMGPNSDGYVRTVSLGGSDLDLYDYWYITDNHSTFGSLNQNFTIPTGQLLSGMLNFIHSTSDDFFDGTVFAFCNLTYPIFVNGSMTNITTRNIWNETWTKATNPVGPVKENINITDYLPTWNFSYTLECGANIISGITETVVAFDEIFINLSMDRYNAMLVMSDGQPTMFCDSYSDYTGSGSGSTSDKIDRDWAINAACNARKNGIDVFSVAFGNAANATTMKKIACWDCDSNDWLPGESENDCSKYFQSNDAGQLKQMYREIAERMGEASYSAQIINLTGNISLDNFLYPDSYLRYNYTPHKVLEYGEVAVSLESNKLNGNVTSPKNGSFYIPSGSGILDAKVISYSSEFWTSLLKVNSSMTNQWKTVYNISNYSGCTGWFHEYSEIGDPFMVHIPVNLLSPGKYNNISIDTGYSCDDFTGGSPDDQVIYYVSVRGFVDYGDIFEIQDNATTNAIQRLQNKLSDFNITMMEVETQSQYVSELPSLWGPSIMEIRIWT